MKKTLSVIIILVVVAFAIVTIVPKFVDADFLVAKVTEEIKKKTGRNLTISGEKSFKIFPNIAIVLNDVSLSGNPDLGESDLFNVKKLQMDLQLKPLIYGDVKIDRLALDGAEINLLKGKNGATSWTFVPVIADTKDSEEVAVGETDKDGNGKVNIELKELKLSNSKVVYFDSLESKNISISSLNFENKYSTSSSSGNYSISGVIDSLGSKDGNFSSSGDYSVAGKLYKVSDIKIDFGGISADANAKFNLESKIPSVETNLIFSEINLDPYVKSGSKSAANSNVSASSKKTWSKEKIDLSFVREINFHLGIKAGSISFDKFVTKNFESYVHIQDGKLIYDLKSAKIYDGDLVGKADIDVTGRKPVWNVDFSVNKVSLTKLPPMEGLGTFNKVNGIVSSKSKVSSIGDNENEIVSNLNGNGSINISDGSLEDVDFLQMFSSTNSVFDMNQMRQKATPFSSMNATYNIKNGVLANDDLSAALKCVNVTGSGKIDFPNRVYDNYRVVPNFDASCPTGKISEVKTAVIVRGDIDNPQFVPDLTGLATDMLLNKLNKKFGGSSETGDSGDTGVKGAIEQGIKGILGGGF